MLYQEKLVRILTSEFEITRKRPFFVALIFRMVFAPEPGLPPLDYIGHGEQEHRFLTRLFEEARRQGEISGEPQELASLLMGDTPLDRKVAEMIVHYLLEGCRTRPRRVRALPAGKFAPAIAHEFMMSKRKP
ncbi:MAG: hypothetical protein HY236_10090 [Acidobacteria bacterium]|nr:hypothetical protein [Acidobacteriota bacterium]